MKTCLSANCRNNSSKRFTSARMERRSKWISAINGPAAAGKVAKPFEGLVPQMQGLYEQTQSEFTRNRIRSFMTYEPCKVCNGARLKPEILAVTIKDRHALELNIHQLSELTTEAATRFIGALELTTQQRAIVRDVVREIQSRLQFL